jgi:hypothetical protein
VTTMSKPCCPVKKTANAQNPDGIQLFKWVRSYREGTVHEEGLGIG